MSAKNRNTYEMKKQVPDRYPSNQDSIGIELVAGTIGPGPDPFFEQATDAQNTSLSWLVARLTTQFGVPMTEIFRHPQVSQKDPHEAETAKW